MTGRLITLRLTILDPVAGVTYSLQDQKSTPRDPVVAGGAPLSFDVPVTLTPDWRLTGTYVRREGKDRRFVYIAVGTQAGDISSPWSRRVKVDVHDLPSELLEAAARGLALEAQLPGRAADGGPACATVRPLSGWQLTGRT